MILLPPKDKLIVEVINEDEAVSESGIILSTGSKDEKHPHDTLQGKVVFAGRESKFVKEGDIIFYEHCHSRPCKLEGFDMIVISEDNILGVILPELKLIEENVKALLKPSCKEVG